MVVPCTAYGTFTTRNATLFIQPARLRAVTVLIPGEARWKDRLSVAGSALHPDWPPILSRGAWRRFRGGGALSGGRRTKPDQAGDRTVSGVAVRGAYGSQP